MKRALEGITVLEMSQYIAGPYTGTMLADMGANVYKIEPNKKESADVGRTFAPFYKDLSLYFATFNRNKNFLTLNLKSKRGQELFKKMVEKADVILNNYRPGTMEKLGLGYEVLKKINPGIIMTCITGFGSSGPQSKKVALDPVIQAESGFMDLNGFPDGSPVKTTPSLSDYVVSMYAAMGTIAAIRYKEQTGRGQIVDVSMLDCMLSITEHFTSYYFLTGNVIRRCGNGRPFSAPSNSYRTSDDRWIYIAAVANNLCARVFELIGQPDLINSPEMCNTIARKKNESTIDELLSAWVATKTSREAIELLDRAGIPNGLVQTIEDVVHNPQIKHREMLVRMPDGALGDIPVVGNPIKFSDSPVEYRTSAKAHGADNANGYKSLLGISDYELEQLHSEDVI